jgi:hypothetical protein
MPHEHKSNLTIIKEEVQEQNLVVKIKKTNRKGWNI